MGEQYIQSATIHRREQQYTQDKNKIYKYKPHLNKTYIGKAT
jgi:hypothetical protein